MLWRVVASSQKFGDLASLANHDRFVPLNAAGRVLMLVRETDRVAELMRRGAAVEKAEIHRRLI